MEENAEEKGMKIFLIIVCMFTGSFLRSQTDSLYNNTIGSLDLLYGYRSGFQKFYDQINTTDKTEFNKPLQTIGFGITGKFLVGPGKDFFGHLCFHQIIPQTIKVQDSIACNITGFVISSAYGWSLIQKAKNINLYIYFGTNLGHLRLYDNSLTRQKNAFISPKAGIQPKIKLGPIAVSFIIEVEYDITNPNWKRSLFFPSKEQTHVSKLRQSGVTGQIGIGYVW
jgi:hypothetical protein